MSTYFLHILRMTRTKYQLFINVRISELLSIWIVLQILHQLHLLLWPTITFNIP